MSQNNIKLDEKKETYWKYSLNSLHKSACFFVVFLVIVLVSVTDISGARGMGGGGGGGLAAAVVGPHFSFKVFVSISMPCFILTVSKPPLQMWLKDAFSLLVTWYSPHSMHIINLFDARTQIFLVPDAVCVSSSLFRFPSFCGPANIHIKTHKISIQYPAIQDKKYFQKYDWKQKIKL